MFSLPLSFIAPTLLFALVLLPIIWMLLRLTPPRPSREVFPPLQILSEVKKQENTASKSPWWLTALRILMAALAISALAQPVYQPQKPVLTSKKPLIIVIDNSWASASNWEIRKASAKRLINEASETNLPVSILFTAEQKHDVHPGSADQALKKINAAIARPVPAQRLNATQILNNVFEQQKIGTIAYLSDGIKQKNDEEFFQNLKQLAPEQFIYFDASKTENIAINAVDNQSAGFFINLIRVSAASPKEVSVTAHDLVGNILSQNRAKFAKGEKSTVVKLTAPFEIRNDFAQIKISNIATAGSTFLIDGSYKRRRVAIFGLKKNETQPLLSPSYYIEKALAPITDIIDLKNNDKTTALDDYLSQSPSVFILTDSGKLPEDDSKKLQEWVKSGGMLIRFSGPRLAASANQQSLLPVTLRKGQRRFGGAFSWEKPQSLAPYPINSPYFGLEIPKNILINRQILAEPTLQTIEHTWASLQDQTPLITAKKYGDGSIVLFHITSENSWSNLPISGHFVEILQRTIALANTNIQTGSSKSTQNILKPFRVLKANGRLSSVTQSIKPITVSNEQFSPLSIENPPGLYGTRKAYIARNLLNKNDALNKQIMSSTLKNTHFETYAPTTSTNLRAPILITVFALLLLDTFLALFFSGNSAIFNRISGLLKHLKVAQKLPVVLCLLFFTPDFLHAQTSKMSDAEISKILSQPRMAYVKTPDLELNRISEAGLNGLSNYMHIRTAYEPGEPIGVNLENDELAFFPIIYWPMSKTAAMPSLRAISNAASYLQNGGTILFDTRDQFTSLSAITLTPQTTRLRHIMANMDIPPLEPAPDDHVLRKSFYLLDSFPGRYAGSKLWVIANTAKSEKITSAISSGDRVSSIIITGNDFAGAWAEDENGQPLLPTIPPNPLQRLYSYRAGINIMMYMLTGNYKADQVHISTILNRLGQ